MSQTPRTDKESYTYNDCGDEIGPVVDVEFAQSLEREINTLKAAIEKHREGTFSEFLGPLAHDKELWEHINDK